MLKVICDGCGKVMPDDFKNVVNVDFNHYELPAGRLNYIKNQEINLCIDCADRVEKFVMEMLEKNRQERKLIEG